MLAKLFRRTKPTPSKPTPRAKVPRRSATIRVGQIVTFRGYADANVDPVLVPGEKVKIIQVNEDGGMIVLPIDNSERQGDTLFPDEIQAITHAEASAPPAQQPTTLKFKLIGAQAETVITALCAAQQLCGSDKPEAALEYVCSHWSETRPEVRRAAAKVKQTAKRAPRKKRPRKR